MAASAFVIAHHHPQGAVAAHLRKLAGYLASQSGKVIFVSTHLAPDAARALPASVTVIERPNVGYDFYSYKTGIEALGDISRLDRVVMLNSSFICLDPRKLCENFFARSRPGIDILGLTSSREIAPHLQSYFVSFEGNRVIASSAFRQWWSTMQPISDRDLVIPTYEVGMSNHFHVHGYTLGAAFSPTPEQKLKALFRWFEFSGRYPEVMADGSVSMDIRAADALNPTHFLWDFLLDEFAVVKAELLRRNPFAMDLRRFEASCRSDAALRGLVDDALSGL